MQVLRNAWTLVANGMGANSRSKFGAYTTTSCHYIQLKHPCKWGKTIINKHLNLQVFCNRSCKRFLFSFCIYMYVSNHFWIIPISLSTIVGAQIDDKAPRRAQIRTSKPSREASRRGYGEVSRSRSLLQQWFHGATNSAFCRKDKRAWTVLSMSSFLKSLLNYSCQMALFV